MQKNKSIWSIIGFLLLALGIMSLIFSMVGLQISFMQWPDALGRGIGFLIRIGMIMSGFIVLYLSLVNNE